MPTTVSSGLDSVPADAFATGVMRRVVRGSAWVGAATWVNRVLGMVVVAVLAIHLSPREFGVVSVAGLCGNITLILGTCGVGDALVYQRDRVRESARTAQTIMTVFGFVTALALLVSAPGLASFFRVPEAGGLIRAYAVVVALGGLSEAPIAMLTRDLRFERRFVPETIGGAVGGLVTVALLVRGTGVWSLVVGDLIREVIVVVLAFAVLPERFGFGWETTTALSLWRYGRHAFASEFFEFGVQNVDYALIARLLGATQLGYYTLAYRAAILPFVLVTLVLRGVSFPLYARLRDDVERLRDAFTSIIETGTTVLFFLGGGLMVLAPSLQIFGERWEPSVMTARALGAYVVLRSAVHFLTPLLAATGHPGADAALRGTWFGLLAILIATFGRGGIATVGLIQVFVAGVMLVAYIRTVRRLVGVGAGLWAKMLVPRAGLTAMAALVILALRAQGGVWAADTSWLTLILNGGCFAVVYGVGALLVVPGFGRLVRQILNVNRAR